MLTLFVRFIVLGITIALFFQCMSALLNPVYRTRKAVKWGLVAYIVVIFSFSTIGCTVNRRDLSAAYIDYRGYDVDGPFEYTSVVNSNEDAIHLVTELLFPISQWLVDGLLVSSASNPVPQVSNTTSAVSLSCHLFYELLGHLHSRPDVPCLLWFVLESLVDLQRQFRLTLLI